MRFKEWDDYLNSMLKHVKFTPDRKKIRQEFGEHMEDMFDDYISDGMSEEDAKNSVLENIGDAEDIGKMMNKAHNALIGWIWQGLKIALVITLIICFTPLASLAGNLGLGAINMLCGYRDTEVYGEPLYTVDIDQEVVIDNHRLYFDDLSKYRVNDNTKDGSREEQYILRFRDRRDFLDVNKGDPTFEITYDMITNDLGEQPDSVGASTGNQGFINYVEMYITGFSDDTKTIIIEYKGNEFYYKGRHFRIEIDLPENKG